MYLVKTPAVLRWLYPNLTWHKDRSKKLIYLTFDDGPIPVVTPFVLKTLKAFGAKATFFCIGENVSKHPDIYKQVLDEGHRVGNHTYNHLKGWDTKDDEYLVNVRKCADVVQSNLFRPPYGRAKRSQISKLINHNSQLKAQDSRFKSQDQLPSTNHSPSSHTSTQFQYSILDTHYSIIMWDVLSGDFDTKLSPEKCLGNVLKHTGNGSIVVFHDSLKAFERLEYILPRALEKWKEEGYGFGVM